MGPKFSGSDGRQRRAHLSKIYKPTLAPECCHEASYVLRMHKYYVPPYNLALRICASLEGRTVNVAIYSAFGKSLCTYKMCWKSCPRASIQAWTRLILFANTSYRSAFGKSLCTYKRCWKWCPRATIQAWTKSTYSSLSAQRLSQSTV
jgi:Pyruvate/2-oxoacid:ferredoxin oxidoreductase delta subunit